MKTAISIPDEIFLSAQRLAKRLGLSRSELYVNALRAYMETHRDDLVMEKLNQVYAATGSEVEKPLRTLQARSLPKEKW